MPSAAIRSRYHGKPSNGKMDVGHVAALAEHDLRVVHRADVVVDAEHDRALGQRVQRVQRLVLDRRRVNAQEVRQRDTGDRGERDDAERLADPRRAGERRQLATEPTAGAIERIGDRGREHSNAGKM